MTQQKNTGMRLRQVLNPRNKDASWLIQMIVAMLASVVLTLTLTGLTGNGWMVILVVSVWLCIVYGILLKTKHESWFYLGTLILMLLLTLVFRKQVLEGFRIFWNTASDAMVSGTGRVLPEWELQFSKEQSGFCVSLFSGVCGCMVSLICCGLTSAIPAVLAVLLPAMMLFGMVTFGAEGSSLWLLPVLAVSVLILMYSGWRRKGSLAPVMMSWAVTGTIACLLIALALLPGFQNWTAQIRENVHESIHEKKYETKYTTLPEGDFSDYQKKEQKAKQALAVTMENPQQLYLRGFTGAFFTGDTWEALDTEALVKNKDLLYWLNLNAFDQNAQFDAAATYAGLRQSTVTVQNIGACSFYRYVPFSIGKGAWAEAENLNTDGVYGNGERSYVYSVTAGSSNEIMEVLTHLQSSEDPAVLQYRKAESGYRQFINHYYLQVPEDVKALLKEEWDEIASRYGAANNLTQQQAQECALIFLSRCFPEEGTPEDMELLLEMAEGTTFQYATVAAMTLRYFGIPARYAEGYVISQEMAAGYESGETMTVDSSCARAWVEVYQDGIGWIPMDLTPGIGEILEDPDSNDPNKGNSSDKDTTKKKDKDEEEEPTEQPEPTGGAMVRIILETILWSLLIVLGMILVVFLILWLRRKLLLGKKEKKFQSTGVSEGIAWIYADTALLLEKLGFDRGNGSMRDLSKPLEEKYGPEFAAQFEAVTNLNDRAMFSSCPMEEDQRKAARKFHSHVLRKLKSELKWYKRMWLKWVRCLY